MPKISLKHQRPLFGMLLIGGLLLASACAARVLPDPHSARRAERYTEAEGMRKAYPSFALSGTGSKMVSEVVGKPRNAITYFDLESGAVRDLQTENPEHQLRNPDISDDGKRIAVVREPRWPIANQSEILILDTEGRVQDRINSCNGWYRKPAFSPDGTKLIYLKYPNANFFENEPIDTRSSGRAPMWQPMEYDFETGTEREIIDLAWLSVSWIDYGPPGRAEYYGRLQEPIGYHPDPPGNLKGKKVWNAPLQTSVLHEYSMDRYWEVSKSAFLALSPDDKDPDKWVVPLYQEEARSFAKRGSGTAVAGVSDEGFLAADRVDYRVYGLIFVPWDDGKEVVLSASEAFAYGRAISRDSCVVLDARRGRDSKRYVPGETILRNMCTGIDKELRLEHDELQDLRVIMGEFENEC